MKITTCKNTALHTAVALALSGLYIGPVSAMGFFDAEPHESHALKNDATAAHHTQAFEKSALSPPTEMPDKLNVITDSLDNNNEAKYYSFTSVRGQRVILNQLNNPATGSYWTYEYKIEGDWIKKHTVTPLITADLKPGQQVELRISKHPTHPPSPDGKFQFEFGSAPYLANHLVSDDASHLPMYLAAHKSFTQLSWSGLVRDSTGHPLEGATIVFEINKNKAAGSSTEIHREFSNINGLFTATADVGKCSGTVISPPYRTIPNGKLKYTISYNIGYWHMYIRGNEKSGVGSKETGDFVSFAHLCSRSRA